MSTRDVIWTMVLSAGFGLLPYDRAAGQCRVNEGAKLIAADASSEDHFGSSVSISGDVALVGAWGDADGGSGSGSAYVYRFNGITWVEEQKLTVSEGAADDNLGWSVSISGDVAVVGARLDDDGGIDSGSAYVYRFDGTTWVEEQKLTASDGTGDVWFGSSASISDNVAVIGAPGDDHAGTNSGSAYVYRFDGSKWIEEQKLTASSAEAFDDFGRSLSVSGDVVVIGVPRDDSPTCSGSAYVYRFNGRTWLEEQKLTASDAASGDSFGRSVSISGDVAVVGAQRDDDDAGSDSGSAYIYRFDGRTWVEEDKLTASDATAGDRFGWSTSISGDVAVVGALEDDDAGSKSGSAYVYRYDGRSWVEEQKMTASDGAAEHFFSVSVCISQGVAVVGANYDDHAGAASGSAYMFGIDPVPTDPPCGAIDARQPSAPDGSDPAGWDSIAMTFDEPPGELNAEDFAVVISPPGDAPTVTDVTVDGNTATVHFDGFIPTRAWTTITHWPTGAVTRIGYLPADVNNDKYSGTNDVLFLVDALNGVIDPMPPSYQTDTDRSGITNLNDVLRVINLLNKSPYGGETWLGATLPQ